MNGKEPYFEIIKNVLKFYAIGELVSVDAFLRKEKDPKTNIIIEFSTTAGKFVFKEYRRTSTKRIQRNIDHCVTIGTQTNEFKIPVILNHNSQGLQIFQNSLFSIEEFVNNQAKPVSREEWYERKRHTAKCLAIFHLFGKEKAWSGTKRASLNSGELKSPVFSVLTNPKDIIGGSFQTPEDDEFEEELVAIYLPYLLNKYKQLVKAWKWTKFNQRKQDLLVCHGDFSPANLLYKKSRVVAIVDYESILIDNNIHSLIKSMIMHIVPNKPGRIPNILLMQDFFECYQAQYGKVSFTSRQLQSYLRFYLIKSCCHKLMIYKRVKPLVNVGRTIKQTNFMDQFNRLKNLMDHESQIISALKIKAKG